MKKSIDLATLKPRLRKEPGYTSREKIALDNADRVVTRIMIGGEWKSKEWTPEAGQTVRQCLENIQSQLRHSPDTRGVVLYVGGENPLTGELMIAAMPQDWIPASLTR